MSGMSGMSGMSSMKPAPLIGQQLRITPTTTP